MLISEYLLMRNQLNVGKTAPASNVPSKKIDTNSVNNSHSEFAQALKQKLDEKSSKSENSVEFSKHAIERLSQRNIDISQSNLLERLNKGVELAAQKGSCDTLILVDQTAFVVSVKNNKVITTMTQDDFKENVFTKIDSTVIM